MGPLNLRITRWKATITLFDKTPKGELWVGQPQVGNSARVLVCGFHAGFTCSHPHSGLGLASESHKWGLFGNSSAHCFVHGLHPLRPFGRFAPYKLSNGRQFLCARVF